MARPASTGVTMAVGSGSLSCGSIALGGTTGGALTTTITISTGNVTVSGNITSAGTDSRIIFTDAGTLNAGGTFMSGTGGTFTCSNGTVNFNGAATQSISPFAYTFNNVILSGSAAKTITNATVNGILSMEGAATATGTANYGSAATLQYKGAASQTTGTEFPATWSGTGGIIIANTNGAVTLTGTKVVNAPLTININSTLNTGNNALTFGGNFINNGTFTANGSPIAISGALDQSHCRLFDDRHCIGYKNPGYGYTNRRSDHGSI